MLNEEYVSPWKISIPDGNALRKLITAPIDSRIAAFHLVRKGSFELQTQDETLQVNNGEVVICTGGNSHLMVKGQTETITPFEQLLDKTSNNDNQQDKNTTALICGVFLLGNVSNNPLINALPEVIHVDVSGHRGGKTLQLLANLLITQLEKPENANNFMTARILEMLCVEAIKDYVQSQSSSKACWFSGLSDPKIGAALNQIHDHPGAPISVDYLAKGVGMSGSRFASRFREKIGMSPMNYVTRWRMNIASRLLIETKLTTETIARKVGYESPPAFSRAFNRQYNKPPARWRREQTNAQPVTS